MLFAVLNTASSNVTKRFSVLLGLMVKFTVFEPTYEPSPDIVSDGLDVDVDAFVLLV